MKNNDEKIRTFCIIQLQIIKDRVERLRKEMLDCRIQTEFLNNLIGDLGKENE
jgi:hypothetical protein